MSLTMKTFTGSSLRLRRGCCARRPRGTRRCRSTWASAGRSPRVAPSSTLKRPRVRAVGDAEQSLGAALREPARPRAHQVGVVGARAADELGPRAHRRAIRCGVLQEHLRTSARAAARTSARRTRRRPMSRVADELRDALLERMLGRAVRVQRPAVRAARGEHARVLAGAVVAELPVRAALLRRRSRGRRPSPRRVRAACAPRRAARARPGATRTRSRARRRRGRRRPRAAGSPGSASATSGRNSDDVVAVGVAVGRARRGRGGRPRRRLRAARLP